MKINQSARLLAQGPSDDAMQTAALSSADGDSRARSRQPRGRKRTAERSGGGLMKAFTLANLALAGGFGALPRAAAQGYQPFATCPAGYNLQGQHTVEVSVNAGANWAWGPCDSPQLNAEFANPPWLSRALASCRSSAMENGSRLGLLGFCDNMVYKKCGQAVNVWLSYLGSQWFCQRN